MRLHPSVVDEAPVAGAAAGYAVLHVGLLCHCRSSCVRLMREMLPHTANRRTALPAGRGQKARKWPDWSHLAAFGCIRSWAPVLPWGALCDCYMYYTIGMSGVQILSRGRPPRGKREAGRPQGTLLRGRGSLSARAGRARRGRGRRRGHDAATMHQNATKMRPKCGQNATKCGHDATRMRPLCTGRGGGQDGALSAFRPLTQLGASAKHPSPLPGARGQSARASRGARWGEGGIPLPGPHPVKGGAQPLGVSAPSPSLAQAPSIPPPFQGGGGNPALALGGRARR